MLESIPPTQNSLDGCSLWPAIDVYPPPEAQQQAQQAVSANGAASPNTARRVTFGHTEVILITPRGTQRSETCESIPTPHEDDHEQTKTVIQVSTREPPREWKDTSSCSSSSMILGAAPPSAQQPFRLSAAALVRAEQQQPQDMPTQLPTASSSSISANPEVIFVSSSSSSLSNHNYLDPYSQVPSCFQSSFSQPLGALSTSSLSQGGGHDSSLLTETPVLGDPVSICSCAGTSSVVEGEDEAVLAPLIDIVDLARSPPAAAARHQASVPCDLDEESSCAVAEAIDGSSAVVVGCEPELDEQTQRSFESISCAQPIHSSSSDPYLPPSSSWVSRLEEKLQEGDSTQSLPAPPPPLIFDTPAVASSSGATEGNKDRIVADAKNPFAASLPMEEEAMAFECGGGSADSATAEQPECVFCHERDEHVVLHSGYYLHIYCALYCPEVYCDPMSGRFKHIDDALKRSRLIKCVVCRQPGASIGCSESTCQRSYHFHCAIDAHCTLRGPAIPTHLASTRVLHIADSSEFAIYCPLHTPPPSSAKKKRNRSTGE